MSPPHRQSVAWISEELGIHLATLYNWRKAWRLQGALPTSSRLYWRALASTPPSSAPTAASGACSRSKVSRWRQTAPTSAKGRACRRH